MYYMYMIYNMYDVVLLPTSWCWRRYKGHSCINDDRTSSTSTSGVRARYYSVEASVPSSYSRTRCGSTKHSPADIISAGITCDQVGLARRSPTVG